MSKVLVTGAAGFIGSHLVDRLLEAGYEVAGLDCFTDYYSPEAKRRNLSRALAHERFALIEGDLLRLDLDGVLDGVEGVAHLAGEPGVRASWGDRFPTYLKRNVETTQRLLEAASRGWPGHFVYASSSSIYGSSGGGPVDEDGALRPASPYGMSKVAAEDLIGLYARERGVASTVLRYFTVYGPRQRPEMALSRFISAVSSGEPVEVFGDGEQTREMTYVSDVVEATVAALEAEPKQGMRAYNVGGGTRTTVGRLVGLVGGTLGERPEVRYRPPVPGDVRSTWADLRRSRQELGYEPQVSLEEGVEEQVRWALAERRALTAV